MIPFHIIYSWLFKSFRINGETELLDRLVRDGYKEFIIIKRSWIFALFTLWIPLVILTLWWISIYIAYYSIDIEPIKYTIISSNILLNTILIISGFNYIRHFREIYGIPRIIDHPNELREQLAEGDYYFTKFFNWSITNQVLLFLTILAEIVLMILYRSHLGEHMWVLTTDIFVMLMAILFLKMYRKRMMDLEMDYNIVVPGKIFFVNQSWVLSSVQSIESSKIKTVRSIFPSKIASFFNYGTIDVLTEWDTQMMMGTMSMYYVTDPDGVVASIQKLLKEGDEIGATIVKSQTIINEDARLNVNEHTYDTREKIRDVLR